MDKRRPYGPPLRRSPSLLQRWLQPPRSAGGPAEARREIHRAFSNL